MRQQGNNGQERHHRGTCEGQTGGGDTEKEQYLLPVRIRSGAGHIRTAPGERWSAYRRPL